MARTQFVLPELHKNVTLEHNFHLIPEELTGECDVMIGIDAMSDVDMAMDFSKNEIG